MHALYTAKVTSTGGRDGGIKSDDGILDLQLALPAGLGGPGGKTNPEQLFAATYAACFHGALKRVAGEQKAAIGHSTVTAEVAIGPKESGGFGLVANLLVTVPGADRETAEKVVRAAHQLCPYSNAIRGNVDVHINVRPKDGGDLLLA